MRWNHKNKDEIKLIVNATVAERSVAPIQKALAALYAQLDKAEDEHERCVRRAEASRVHYSRFVQYVREKLVARCDGSIMSGAFDWKAHMPDLAPSWTEDVALD